MMVMMLTHLVTLYAELYCQFMYTKRMFEWEVKDYSYFTMVQVVRFSNVQGHREFRSESYCLFLPKYENYGLFNPTGGSPDVVHLII